MYFNDISKDNVRVELLLLKKKYDCVRDLKTIYCRKQFCDTKCDS